MLVEIQSNLYYPIHPQHPPRSSDKNQQHLNDRNLHMTLNLSINEFIKNKSIKHTRQKKLNFDDEKKFKTYTLHTQIFSFTIAHKSRRKIHKQLFAVIS